MASDLNESDGKNGSYGLQNVKERAVEIGATCKIVSVPSQGTIVEVKLPIEKICKIQLEKGEQENDSNIISG